MQIREMNLKELEVVFEVLSQLRVGLCFKEFDDLIYDMRHMEYKMIGLFERGVLVTYAGVAVQTNLYHKRHLYIFDLVTDKKFRSQGYAKEMMEYLKVYAKTAMCENLVLSCELLQEEAHQFYEKEGFSNKNLLLLKAI